MKYEYPRQDILRVCINYSDAEVSTEYLRKGRFLTYHVTNNLGRDSSRDTDKGETRSGLDHMSVEVSICTLNPLINYFLDLQLGSL